METITEKITLGGGCFWCLDPIYSDLRGVKHVSVGYSGGRVPNPPYRLVCTGLTGHAEVVQVEFDPQEISLEDVLRVFFSIHDPTTLNRQGADVGTQYRSVIFYNSTEQKETAQRVRDEIELSKIWPTPIVTEIVPFVEFYPAEDYHQKYFEKNPDAGYCQIVIAPKVAKFRKSHLERLKL